MPCGRTVRRCPGFQRSMPYSETQTIAPPNSSSSAMVPGSAWFSHFVPTVTLEREEDFRTLNKALLWARPQLRSPPR